MEYNCDHEWMQVTNTLPEVCQYCSRRRITWTGEISPPDPDTINVVVGLDETD